MAEVLSFEAGRERFAERHAHRIARREQEQRKEEEERRKKLADLKPFADGEREHWMEDLSTWPSPFFSALAGAIRSRTAPERVNDEIRGGAAIYHYRSGTIEKQLGGGFIFQERVRWALMLLRGAARDLRAAKIKGHKGSITRRRRELRDMKCRLLRALWLYGRPKIVRSEIEPYAREENEEQRTQLPGSILAQRNEISREERRLKEGIYLIGAKKGQPLSEQYREQKRRKIERLNKSLDSYLDRLRLLETEPDPLKAWGVYAQRSTPRWVAGHA